MEKQVARPKAEIRYICYEKPKEPEVPEEAKEEEKPKCPEVREGPADPEHRFKKCKDEIRYVKEKQLLRKVQKESSQPVPQSELDIDTDEDVRRKTLLSELKKRIGKPEKDCSFIEVPKPEPIEVTINTGFEVDLEDILLGKIDDPCRIVKLVVEHCEEDKIEGTGMKITCPVEGPMTTPPSPGVDHHLPGIFHGPFMSLPFSHKVKEEDVRDTPECTINGVPVHVEMTEDITKDEIKDRKVNLTVSSCDTIDGFRKIFLIND